MNQKEIAELIGVRKDWISHAKRSEGKWEYISSLDKDMLVAIKKYDKYVGEMINTLQEFSYKKEYHSIVKEANVYNCKYPSQSLNKVIFLTRDSNVNIHFNSFLKADKVYKIIKDRF